MKLTVSKIAKLINKSPKYIYTLLRRKGISMLDEDCDKLIDLICEYRCKKDKPLF